MSRPCDVCKKKTNIKSRKEWTDYQTGKKMIVCPGCYNKAKGVRRKGFQFRAGLGKGKYTKVKELKRKNRRKYYQNKK